MCGLNKHPMYNESQTLPVWYTCFTLRSFMCCSSQEVYSYTQESNLQYIQWKLVMQPNWKSSPLFCSFCCWYSVEYQRCSCLQKSVSDLVINIYFLPIVPGFIGSQLEAHVTSDPFNCSCCTNGTWERVWVNQQLAPQCLLNDLM